MDFYVLPMHGADIVLDISWLATLGPTMTCYGARIFEFTLGNKGIRWVGEPHLEAQPVQLQTLHKYSTTDSIAFYYCFMMVQSEGIVDFDHSSGLQFV